MSRKLDSRPVSQKYMTFTGWPSWVTIWITERSAPFSPAFRMAMAGIMLTKMPANSLATSAMGPQLKSFLMRDSGSVSFRDSPAMTSRTMSRTMFWSSTGTWYTTNSTPGFQKPLMSTAATTPPSSSRFTLPSRPSFSPPPCCGGTGRPSLPNSTVSSAKNTASSSTETSSMGGSM